MEHPRQVIPEAEWNLLSGVLGLGLICHQRIRKAVDIITMLLAQNSEFNLVYHFIAYNARHGKIVTILEQELNQIPQPDKRPGE